MSTVFIIIKMCYVHNQWYDISCATLYLISNIGFLQHVSNLLGSTSGRQLFMQYGIFFAYILNSYIHQPSSCSTHPPKFLLRTNKIAPLPHPSPFRSHMFLLVRAQHQSICNFPFIIPHIYIQGVPGGMDKTSEGCSLC